MTDPIVKRLDLACTPAHAFDVFVNRTARWWPLGSHAVTASEGKPALAVTIEPRVGGAVYETAQDGSRHPWGEVLAFETGREIAFTWHPGGSADQATRVSVAFEDHDGGTRVTLTHSGWEVWAGEATERRGNYDSGWDMVFGQCFAGALSGKAEA